MVANSLKYSRYFFKYTTKHIENVVNLIMIIIIKTLSKEEAQLGLHTIFPVVLNLTFVAMVAVKDSGIVLPRRCCREYTYA